MCAGGRRHNCKELTCGMKRGQLQPVCSYASGCKTREHLPKTSWKDNCEQELWDTQCHRLAVAIQVKHSLVAEASLLRWIYSTQSPGASNPCHPLHRPEYLQQAKGNCSRAPFLEGRSSRIGLPPVAFFVCVLILPYQRCLSLAPGCPASVRSACPHPTGSSNALLGCLCQCLWTIL